MALLAAAIGGRPRRRSCSPCRRCCGHDGIDWDWLPGRADEVPPEPGHRQPAAAARPAAGDTAAPARLHELVRAIADDRAAATAASATAGSPPTSTAHPAGLDLAEADTLITALEALPIQETP